MSRPQSKAAGSLRPITGTYTVPKPQDAATGPTAGSASAPAAGPGFGPAPDSSGEEPRNTPSGLPRRTRPTGWADPPPPVPDITPADPQSVFDDLAAFDAGQRAAADAPAWEGPWES